MARHCFSLNGKAEAMRRFREDNRPSTDKPAQNPVNNHEMDGNAHANVAQAAPSTEAELRAQIEALTLRIDQLINNLYERDDTFDYYAHVIEYSDKENWSAPAIFTNDEEQHSEAAPSAEETNPEVDANKQHHSPETLQ